MDNNHDILRDPIWQFIGVVVGVVAIFMAYLTLPSSAQGKTLVMVAVIIIILLLILFVRNKITRLLLTCAFFVISYVWMSIIDGLTYYQISFFTQNFGINGPGVIYGKSDIGSALLIIEYILLTTTLLLCLYACLIKKNYGMALSVILLYTCLLFFSIPTFYIPNFLNTKVLIIDFAYPKTVLGSVMYILLFLSFVLFFLNDKKKPAHLPKKSSHKRTNPTL